MDLAFDQLRGNEVAEIVHGDIGFDCRHASARVDLQFCHVAAVRERHAGDAIGGAVQRVGRRARRIGEAPGEVEQADRRLPVV